MRSKDCSLLSPTGSDQWLSTLTLSLFAEMVEREKERERERERQGDGRLVERVGGEEKREIKKQERERGGGDWAHLSGTNADCQVSGVTRSELGQVGPVSLCFDWVWKQVWPAVSTAVWLHVQLLKQISSEIHFACCCYFMQPRNKQS